MPFVEEDELKRSGIDVIHLCETADAFNQYGATKSAIRILCLTNLLSTTSKVGLESLISDDSVAIEKIDSLKLILDSLKEKAAQWSAKIIVFFKSKGEWIITQKNNLLESIRSKILKAKNITASGVSKVKVYSNTVIRKALEACMSVVGIFAFVGRTLSSIKNTQAIKKFTDTLTNMINGIKWPFGSVSAKMSDNNRNMDVSVTRNSSKIRENISDAAGWTKSTIENIARLIENVCGGIETAWNTLYPKAVSVGGAIINYSKSAIQAAVAGFRIGHNALNDDREIPQHVSEKSIIKEVANIGLGSIVGVSTWTLFLITTVVIGLYKLASKIIIGTLRICGETITKLSNRREEEYV